MFTTHTAAGVPYILNKEDVSDVVYNIDPVNCPLATAFGRVRQNGQPHKENKDSLAAYDADSAAVQGADAPDAADTTPTQSSFYSQIYTKTAKSSGTMESIGIYGMNSQLDYQIAKKLKEIKRDQEATLISANATQAPAGEVTPGKSAGIFNLITTHVNSTENTLGDSAGKQSFNLLLQQVYDGGGMPTQVYVGGTQKRNISENWTTNVTVYDSKNIRQRIETVDVYVSDFGAMNINYHWMMALSYCAILQMDHWKCAVAPGREWFTQELAKVGDYTAVQIVGEYGLVTTAEDSSAAFTGLTS